MPKAISYIRFSTGRQSTGTSHQRQQEAVTRWLVQHPDYVQSDLSFADLGKSGYHGEHIKQGGGWAKLLIAVKAGVIQPGDVVLVEAIDRTGRLPALDMLNEVIAPILKAGVSIVTLDDNTTYTIDSVGGSQIFLLIAKIQAAHGYSKQLSERVTASYEIRRQKAKNGEKIKRFAVAWLTTDGKLKPRLVPYVQQVFDLYISGVGKNTIANRLRESGEPELALISAPTIDAWLQNRAAVGYWNAIPNVYDPIVTPEVFLQAQKRRQEMKTKPPSRTSKNFLVGLIKCGVCGANYIIHNKDGKPNNMRCLTHQRLKEAGCSNKETIPYQVVHFVYLSSAPAWIDKAMKVIQLTDNEKRKLTLNTEREEITASIQRLAKKLAQMDSVELEAEFDLANERRASIDSELSVLERTSDDGAESKSRSNYVGYEEVLEHDRLAFHDPIQLSALLKQAGYSVSVQPGRKLYLPDDNDPWVYAGVVRRGNRTLGYRIRNSEEELTISQTIPEVPDVRLYGNIPNGDLIHIAERSYKHAKHPTQLKSTDNKSRKGVTVLRFESAGIAMQYLKGGIEPD
jgi:DNA invertase Pin-like site-specific DNA recombinase